MDKGFVDQYKKGDKRRSDAYTAAFSAGRRVSQYRKPPMRAMEMNSGGRTSAEPHPAVEPVVTAKMKRIRAAVDIISFTTIYNQNRQGLLPVRMDTPIISRLLKRFNRDSLSERSDGCAGITKVHVRATGTATIATNQKTHGHDANSTSTAPIVNPRTACVLATSHGRRPSYANVPFPMAPQPPNMPIARACSVGSGKTLTSKVRAEGIVSEAAMKQFISVNKFLTKETINPPIPLNARRTIKRILFLTNPVLVAMTPSVEIPVMNAASTQGPSESA